MSENADSPPVVLIQPVTETITKWFFPLLLALLYIILFVVSISAQSDTGSITGIVNDEDGQALSGVALFAKDRETGIEKKVHTAPDGQFYISTLRPGTYDITATLEGFGTTRQQGITVSVGSRITTKIVLLPHKEELVEVTAANQSTDTTRSHISDVVGQQKIQDLPLNGRNFLELAFLTPGNFAAPNFDPTKTRIVEVATPGSMGRGANVIVDGVDDNDEFVGGVLQNFSQDAIGEFQMLTSRFSAETGRSASSAINIVTKSGTNDTHGTAFIFYRDDSLQAKNPLLSKSDNEPPFDRQQAGFTLGGPIIRDKAFWFASLEYLNEDGAVSAGTRDVAAQQIVTTLAPTPVDDFLLTVRTDWKTGNSDNIFGRYSFQQNTITSKGYVLFSAPLSDISNFQEASNHLHSGVFGWTKLASSNIINEFRVGEMNFFNLLDSQAEPPELSFPSIVVGKNAIVPQRTHLNRFQIKDDLTWTIGEHLFKAGSEIQRVDTDFFINDVYGGSIVLSENFAQKDRNGDGVKNDNDIPVIYAIRNTAGESFIPNVDNSFLAFYVQDDWRIRDGLTLNLGLRYELDTASNGANDLNEQERLHFYPNDDGIRKRDKNNIAPRIGFAWDIRNDGTLLVRGGYGLYYDRITLQIPTYERLLNGVNVDFLGTGDALLGDPFAGEPANTPAGILILSNNMEIPRSQQFSIGIEHTLWREINMSADYISSRGDHFLTLREVNHPRVDIQVNPEINDNVQEIASIADINYNGLLVSATKRFGSYFQVQASYTLARMQNWNNDEQQPTIGFDAADPSKDQGRAEHQDTHRLVLNGIYRMSNGFQIAGIFTYASGIPFDIKTNRDFLGDGYMDRFPLLPRNAGGAEVRTGVELNHWINVFNTSNDPAIVAMRQHCGCTLPLVDPNLQFTDNFINLDLRFSKNFIFGKYQLEPILELFNVFNITNIRGSQVNNLSGYQTNMEAADFGKPFSTAGGAFGQGGPFAVQLAIRFQF